MQSVADVLYQRANLPDIYWNTNVHPRFKDVNTERNAAQKAYQQAQVFKSLLANPRQLTEFPRRWRLGAFSTPIEYASLALAGIVREAIRHSMRVTCCSLTELPSVNQYQSRYELVFVHDVFDDLEPRDYMPLREAHTKNFHLFYSMSGNLQSAIDLLKTSPDYAFQIEQASLHATHARTI